MNGSKLVIRCDQRYLGILLAIRLTIATGIAAFAQSTATTSVAILFALGCIIIWYIQTRLWKYTIDSKKIHTEKIFTSQMDLHTPIERIVGFNTKEGILEALLNVHTVIISTASSQADQVSIKWPYVRTNVAVTKYLESCIEESKKTKN